MISAAAPGLALVVVLGGAALAQTTPAGGSVLIAPSLQVRLGVRTSALKLEKRRGEIDAFAKVLDPGPLVALQADLSAAIAAAGASAAEARRSKALNARDGSVSNKEAEAAEAQALQDEIKVKFLRQRVDLEWGPGVGRLNGPQRARLIAEVVSGRAALVHVDTPSNVGQAGARTVKVDVGSDSVTGRVLGPARASEPRLQSSGLIVVVSGPSAILLSNGLTQSAHIVSGAAESGVVVPGAAVIRYRGLAWAYVRQNAGTFERRLLTGTTPQAMGLFATGGVSPGEPVVTEGAVAVFAAELSRPAAPGR